MVDTKETMQIRIDGELHRQLKILAVLHSKFIGELVEGAVMVYYYNDLKRLAIEEGRREESETKLLNNEATPRVSS